MARDEVQKELRVTVEQLDSNDGLPGATYSLRVRRKLMSFHSASNDQLEWIANWPFSIFLGKTPNYLSHDESKDDDESEESGSEVQDSDNEPSEPDEESGEEDEAVGCDGEDEQNGDRVDDNEMPTKRVKTENWVPDEEVQAFDDPIRSSQQTIKREHDSDFQTENDGDMATAPHESSDPIQSTSPTIILSSEEDGDKEASSGQYDIRVSCYEMSTKKVKTEHLVPESEVYAFDDLIRGSQSSDDSEQVGELSPQSITVRSANLKLVYDVEYRAPH